MKKLLPILLLITLVACGDKDLDNAKKSLVGNWTVNRVYTQLPGGNDQQQTGNLGTFQFTQNQLNYSFTKDGATQNGQSAWNLRREMVNSGFVKVEKYTLDFDGRSFVCAFGDETSDAEKNATAIRLEDKDGSGNDFQMWLTK